VSSSAHTLARILAAFSVLWLTHKITPAALRRRTAGANLEAGIVPNADHHAQHTAAGFVSRKIIDFLTCLSTQRKADAASGDQPGTFLELILEVGQIARPSIFFQLSVTQIVGPKIIET
jgi:hypothetical protein